MSWELRDAVDEDHRFIVPYWRAGYEHAPEVQKCERTWYRVQMSRRIAWCLEHGTTRVACLEDDPDAILGFACVSKPGTVLHYAAVRKEARGVGIARALLAEHPRLVSYSHRPFHAPKFLDGLAYTPFIFGPESP